MNDTTDCIHPDDGILWNQWNKVVQCHRCGHVIVRPIEAYIKEMQDDSARWFPNGGRDLLVLVLGLVGESGEVADQLKKYLRNPSDEAWEMRKEKLVTEIIDVFHYWCLLVGLLEIDVDEVYRRKREYNIERYERHDKPSASLQ